MKEVIFSFLIAVFILIYIFASGFLYKKKYSFLENINPMLSGFYIQICLIMIFTAIPNFLHMSWNLVNIIFWSIIVYTIFQMTWNYKYIFISIREYIKQVNKLYLLIIIFSILFIYITEIFIANGQKLSHDGTFWIPTYVTNIGLDRINTINPYSGVEAIGYFRNYIFNSYSLLNSFLIANTGLNAMVTTGLIIPAIIGSLYVSILCYFSKMVSKISKNSISAIGIFIFIILLSYFTAIWKLTWMQLNMVLGSTIAYTLVPILTVAELLRLVKEKECLDLKESMIRLSLISCLGMFFSTTSVYIGGYILFVFGIIFFLDKKQRFKIKSIILPITIYLVLAVLSLISHELNAVIF